MLDSVDNRGGKEAGKFLTFHAFTIENILKNINIELK